MKKKKFTDIVEIQDLRKDLDEWRSNKDKGKRIPDGLWERAVLLAEKYNVNPVAKITGINYTDLRRRLEIHKKDSIAPVRTDEPGFISLNASLISGGRSDAGATVEMFRNDGSKMTVRMQSAADLNLPGLVEAFWRG